MDPDNHNRVMTSSPTRPKAVIFDLGGVVISSPFPFLIDFDSKVGMPQGTLASVILSAGPEGAWQRLERGEVSMTEFTQLLGEECFKRVGRHVDVSRLLDSFMTDFVLKAKPYPQIIDAILCLRADGIKTALLTNTFSAPENTDYLPVDLSLFDVVVESARVNMRKPEERIYRYTLDQLLLKPEDVIFLDDLSENVRGATEIGIRAIKVSNPDQAVADLEREVGTTLRGFVPGTISVPDRLAIDIEELGKFLQSSLHLSSNERPVVRCFEHGQSNPTYLVRYAGKNMVLRKKPPGKLLPSAHAVEREYRVMAALRTQGVPVPNMLALCRDESVLGTPFYLMDHVPGRVFIDPTLPGLTREERKEIYAAMCKVLVQIHKVNIMDAGLQDYGKSGDFVKRNFARWSQQYKASKTEEMPSMNNLMQWLADHIPTSESTTLVHGDFRLDNLIFHPTRAEVVAVIDWELSTLGNPLTDLANNCLAYYMPTEFPLGWVLDKSKLSELGIPHVDDYLNHYAHLRGLPNIDEWDLYVAYTFFRSAAILQGVYKRFTIGQASSPKAELSLVAAKIAAEIGWNIASNSKINSAHQRSSLQTTPTSSAQKEMSRSGTSLPLSVAALSARAQDFHQRIKSFITENVLPVEAEFYEWSSDPAKKWTVNPTMEKLKARAKSQGLWNLFIPHENDPDHKYGPGLTNVEYAYIAEEMGRSLIASEVFNCSAPDTGNMEILIRYGTEAQKEQWLKPLLDGVTRSCFGMTEPAVASSDATNIQSSIMRNGDHYVINGRKWWTSGAMDPRCKICIFMGKTSTSGRTHEQQSMIIVPMDAAGVKIIRPLTVFGYDDSPHGHAEVLFENVRVPVSNILLGEGRGFEIAQGRLGPGRIHHCMRSIGLSERALQLMVERVQKRVAFGKPLLAFNSIQQDIAKSRIEIEQCRLLVLKAAHLMDTVGNKAAAPEIAMIKVSVPSIACQIVDRAIQAHGGMGVCGDVPLAYLYAHARTLRLADGPDEVHLQAVARMEIRSQRQASKL